MRPVLWGDLVAATAWAAANPARPVAALIDRAQAADLYRKHHGRPHPRWGNGSLMAAALAEAAPPVRFDDPAALAALAQVAAALARRRTGTLAPAALSARLDENQEAQIMAERWAKVAAIDPVWTRIRSEAEAAVRSEPLLGGLIHSSLLHHASLENALAYRFSLKLASGEMSEQILREIADAAHSADPDLGAAARADLVAVHDRDPACHRLLQPILFFKGFQALQAYRIGHWLWREGRRDMAYFVQMRVSEVFGVDIHPAARMGRGVMIDHAHSIVIGETAVVGDNVSMLHSVTLGGTGKDQGDRHPKIGNGVLIGAGAKVLGNIHVGDNARIAAGSVVLADVPCCKTVAGVPARVVGDAGCDQPGVEMDQLIRES